MHITPRALAPLAFIAGLAYSTSIRVRNLLYDSSILPRHRLSNPVISIGNITTGGTGKTPLVIYAADKFKTLGFIPVILSRGYGRSKPDAPLIIAPGRELRFPAHELGDEPALIRRHVPEAWFGIARDRFYIGSRIERFGGKLVFILDDGFQHRRLHRDLDIVVINTSQPLGSNRLLPGGTLREPLTGLLRGDAIVMTNARYQERTVDSVLADVRSLQLEAEVFQCEQSIEKLIPFISWSNDEGPGPSCRPIDSAFLVAAVGNPSRFQADVTMLGIRVSGFRFFRDHHKLRAPEWQDCVRYARETGAEAIIVTEKDAVKITEPPDFPLLVAVQTTRFINENSFVELLRRCTYQRVNV